MATLTPYVDLKDVQKKFDNLVNCIDKSGVVFEKTLKDMRSRAPGKVADAVRSVYNIKKSDLMPTKEQTDLKRAGTIQARGTDIMSFKLIYEGRRLTPLHFGMNFTPKNVLEEPFKIKKKKGKEIKIRKEQKITAKIKKGKKFEFKPENEDGGVFLAPARKGSSRILPWERYSSKSYDISPIKTMSLPQMVGPSEGGQGGNPIVMKQISDSLTELLDTRFRYHYKKHTGKELK